MKRSPRGIALLVILWVMTVLTAMAFSFTVMTRAESCGTLAFRERDGEEAACRGGDRAGHHGNHLPVGEPEPGGDLAGMEAWKPDGTDHTVDTGKGGYIMRIIDESGKIPLNGLTDSSGIVLKNLLVNLGSQPRMPMPSSTPSSIGRMPTICTTSTASNRITTCRSRNPTRPRIGTSRPSRN